MNSVAAAYIDGWWVCIICKGPGWVVVHTPYVKWCLCSELKQILSDDGNSVDVKGSSQCIYWQVKFPFPLSNRDVSLPSCVLLLVDEHCHWVKWNATCYPLCFTIMSIYRHTVVQPSNPRHSSLLMGNSCRILWGLLNHSVSLTLCFNGHFPGEPGLAGVYWSKGWWRWWWQ